MAPVEFEEIDGPTLEAEIIMLRAASDIAVLIVEGYTDEKLFSRFIDHERCSIVVAYGKQNALTAIQLLNERGETGVVCLIDRDYDNYLGVTSYPDNSIVTDAHDLESIIFCSNALNKVLIELGSKAKLIAHGDPRSAIYDAARPIGVARLLSHQHSLNLVFSGIDLKFICKKTLSTDIALLAKVLISRSNSTTVKWESFFEMITEKLNDFIADNEVCCGHDLTAVLAKSLQTMFGTNNANAIHRDDVESRLRLAYETSDFKKATVFSDLSQWQDKNTPYRVLSPAF